MASVDVTIERQQQLFGVISRAMDNLKKLGSAKINRGSVQSRIEALKSNWDKFQDNHESLFQSITSEHRKLSYFKDELYAKCEEAFLEAHGDMLNTMESLEHNSNPNSSTAEISLNSSAALRSWRLPRIEVPKFSGDYAQWSQFRDLFVSMIMENTDISTVEKFHYLKMSVSGEPAQHLKNISITSDNFSRAWNSLVARYENKRILIDAQLAALFSARKIKTENATDIKRLLGDVKEALGALEALDCPVQHWDLVIIFMMTRKLDAESLKRWEDTLGAQSNPPSFNDFETFLLGRIYTLEALERSLSRKQSPNSPASRPSAGARAYTATSVEQKCSLCSANHYLSSCPKYLEKTSEQRREIIVSKRLCFNCLGPHAVKACRNTKRCRTCSKPHHTTLHTPASNSNIATSASSLASSASIPNASASQDGMSAAPSPSQHELGMQTSSHIAQSRIVRNASVLLATALVNVLSRHGQTYQVRALLDRKRHSFPNLQRNY